MAVVEALYYTDPFCPWSWALEPQLRHITQEFGANLRITYVMSGMRSELADETAVALQVLEASAASGMPVDVRLWLRDPPRSSHPACIAVKAAAEQEDAGMYLRRLREAVMCRQRKLEGADELTAEARAVSELNLDRFKLDLGSNAILEKFGFDLDRAQAVDPSQHSEGSDRVKLPSIEFRGPDGEVHGAYGHSECAELRQAAVAAGAEPTGAPPPSIAEALRRYGSMAAAEVAAVCDLPGPAASAELWRLAAEWKVKPERLGSGELWTLA
jgi:predicted DsbA family dithiol-disulfide isomerase